MRRMATLILVHRATLLHTLPLKQKPTKQAQGLSRLSELSSLPHPPRGEPKVSRLRNGISVLSLEDPGLHRACLLEPKHACLSLANAPRYLLVDLESQNTAA